MSLLHSEIYQSEQRALPITERSTAYGDGVFTTAKIMHGKVVDLTQHLNRLKSSTEKLLIGYNDQGLGEHLANLAKRFELAVLKVIVTAGEGGRGYSRINSSAQKILITVHEYPQHYDKWSIDGITVGIAKFQLGVNPGLAGIKHLNRLEQVLLRQELDSRPEDDLLALNCNGHIIEVSAGNVFWRKKGEINWQTPTLEQSGVDGLLRQKILSVLPRATIVTVNVEQLADVQSMFICNSIMGIVPVKVFDNQSLDISQVHQLKSELSL